jgi:hypothetical protein
MTLERRIIGGEVTKNNLQIESNPFLRLETEET